MRWTSSAADLRSTRGIHRSPQDTLGGSALHPYILPHFVFTQIAQPGQHSTAHNTAPEHSTSIFHLCPAAIRLAAADMPCLRPHGPSPSPPPPSKPRSYS
ncbi:hypothetical protein CGGC5_v012476 [Colletotrichum fructicola Nara gc5]|uniref:Uncharacterized protein n=2 Tax=Colletotrichum gloeosporioides species complex TaxID=2707338 RepID=A0A7J6IPW9_COLFN|nr:hypothetical protein CGGC5_v012476 [Colletotrichum fructicola Nara gc5]KAK1839114.1 hypothetical protein CCHR01_18267 [Colletotrichum chrysophilum]